MLAYVLMPFVEVHRYVFLRDILSLDEVTEPTFRHRVPVCVISVIFVSIVLFLVLIPFPWDIPCAVVLGLPCCGSLIVTIAIFVSGFLSSLVP